MKTLARRVESFPFLVRAGGNASRFAYSHITATAHGNAMVQIAAGRRNVTVNGAITDHEHRFAQALEHMLREKTVRIQLRELLDSYGDTP